MQLYIESIPIMSTRLDQIQNSSDFFACKRHKIENKYIVSIEVHTNFHLWQGYYICISRQEVYGGKKSQEAHD